LTNKGMTLIATIMLMVFVSIAVAGASVFVVQWILQLNAEQFETKCLYLAQAGIHDAIYSVRSTHNPPTTNGYYSLGLTAVNSGETFRRGATAAELLMVDTSAVSLSGRDVFGLRIQKATNSATPAVTLASLVITFSQTGSNRRLSSVTIGGIQRWSGNANSPANININDVALTTTNTMAIDRIRFNNNINLTGMTIQFVMTDGSSKTVTCYPASNNCIFTINATGKVSGSVIYRTLSADYNLMPTTYATTSRINVYHEINTEITTP